MSDYIRREDAVDALAKTMPTPATPDGAGEFDHEIHIADEAFADAIRIIESLEPADVVPVAHAHWYILEYESLTCSRCGGFYYTGCDSTTEAKERLKKGIYPQYCPNCGAKMDGEE